MNEFKLDLMKKDMSSTEILNKYIFCGDPFIFQKKIGLYSTLKTKMANKFNIEVTKVFMGGSAKLGFSIAKSQLWKPFDDDSDIDMVIISDAVFDNLWKDLSDLNTGLYDKSEREEKKLDSFFKYFFRGWIRPDFLPLSHKKTQEWLDYFISISYKEFGPYKVTGAVFKNEFFFRKYHERNINRIRQGVNYA